MNSAQENECRELLELINQRCFSAEPDGAALIRSRRHGRVLACGWEEDLPDFTPLSPEGVYSIPEYPEFDGDGGVETCTRTIFCASYAGERWIVDALGRSWLSALPGIEARTDLDIAPFTEAHLKAIVADAMGERLSIPPACERFPGLLAEVMKPFALSITGDAPAQPALDRDQGVPGKHRYNHALSLGFEFDSDAEDGSDMDDKPGAVYEALQHRMNNIFKFDAEGRVIGYQSGGMDAFDVFDTSTSEEHYGLKAEAEDESDSPAP